MGARASLFADLELQKQRPAGSMSGGLLCKEERNYRDVAVLGDVQELARKFVADLNWEVCIDSLVLY